MKLSIFACGVMAFAASSLCAQDPVQEPAPSGHSDVWVADFDKAAEMAKKASKDLLVDFTGSDWCGWCIRLNKEVFDHEEFLKEATQNFVLVALDFPQGEEAKAKVPNPERNQALMEKYGVQGFPSILLMTAEGEVFGTTGYQEGGPEAYLTHLKELTTKGKEGLAAAKKLADEYDSGTAEVKAAAFTKAIEFLSKADAGQAGVSAVAAIVKTGLATASDEAKVPAWKALLKVGAADEAVLAAAREADPKNEKGLLEHVVKAETSEIQSEEDLKAAAAKIEGLLDGGKMHDKELEKEFHANLAFWNKRFLDDEEKAKAHATKLKALAGEDDPKFGGLIKMVLGG